MHIVRNWIARIALVGVAGASQGCMAAAEPGGTPDAGDGSGGGWAGAAVSVSLGSTGRLDINPDGLGGTFHEDDTIVRASGEPECVGFVRSESKPLSNAGVVTVTGDFIGREGGLPGPVTVRADEDNVYSFNSQPDQFLWLPLEGSMDLLQVELGGSGYAFPAMPPLVLHAPTQAWVDVLAPVNVEGELVVPSDAPFVFRWTPPRAGEVTRLLLWMDLDSIRGRDGEIFCFWPAERGDGSIPAALLADLRRRIGGPNPIPGFISLFTGDGAEVARDMASYVFLVPAGFHSLEGQSFRLE